LNYYYEEAPLWILDNVNFIGKNIGQGAYAIKKILSEFEKAFLQIVTFQEKMEVIAAKYKEKINCIEDMEKIEDDELKQLQSFNIAKSLVSFQS